MVGYISHANSAQMGIDGGALLGLFWPRADIVRMSRLQFKYRRQIEAQHLDQFSPDVAVKEMIALFRSVDGNKLNELEFLESLNPKFFKKWAAFEAKRVLTLAHMTFDDLNQLDFGDNSEYKKVWSYVHSLHHLETNPVAATDEIRKSVGWSTGWGVRSYISNKITGHARTDRRFTY